MARAPDQRVAQAKALYDKGLKLIDIANQLGIPEGTVRSWKNRYNWDCNVAKEKRNAAKRKGGQPDNKNAEGHGAPPKNKNAVKTGEFETLFFDNLNPADFHSDLFFPLRQHAVEDTLHLEAFHIFYVLLL